MRGARRACARTCSDQRRRRRQELRDRKVAGLDFAGEERPHPGNFDCPRRGQIDAADGDLEAVEIRFREITLDQAVHPHRADLRVRRQARNRQDGRDLFGFRMVEGDAEFVLRAGQTRHEIAVEPRLTARNHDGSLELRARFAAGKRACRAHRAEANEDRIRLQAEQVHDARQIRRTPVKGEIEVWLLVLLHDAAADMTAHPAQIGHFRPREFQYPALVGSGRTRRARRAAGIAELADFHREYGIEVLPPIIAGSRCTGIAGSAGFRHRLSVLLPRRCRRLRPLTRHIGAHVETVDVGIDIEPRASAELKPEPTRDPRRIDVDLGGAQRDAIGRNGQPAAC